MNSDIISSESLPPVEPHNMEAEQGLLGGVAC